jgi:hypothetical protein
LKFNKDAYGIAGRRDQNVVPWVRQCDNRQLEGVRAPRGHDDVIGRERGLRRAVVGGHRLASLGEANFTKIDKLFKNGT